jgi:predicted amidohydrolase
VGADPAQPRGSQWLLRLRPQRIGHEHILDATGKPVSAKGIEFWGQSFVAAPTAKFVQRASIDKEEVLIVPCDRKRSSSAAPTGPFLRDRRIDCVREPHQAVRGRDVEDGSPLVAQMYAEDQSDSRVLCALCWFE